MKSKNALLAVVLLLAAAGTLVLVREGDTVATGTPESGQLRAGGVRPREGDGAGQRGPTVQRPRPSAAYRELVAEYGEARVRFSRQMAESVVRLHKDWIAQGERAAEFMPASGAKLLVEVDRDIALDEHQRAKVEDLFRDFQRREAEAVKAAIDELSARPEPLMRLMLAGDKFARGEMSEEQYLRVRQTGTRELQVLWDPSSRQRKSWVDLLIADEGFRQGMLEILDASQADRFQAAVAARLPTAATLDQGTLAGMQPTGLESLKSSVERLQAVSRTFAEVMGMMGKAQPPSILPRE